ncbi:hypothetical protein E2C01_038599 [Portunus trituberculatus]|uniref:Uncharacterized protein n=1 Tax=Portunus trituberculatus TaxID=210409 RepID=A0A5B7FH83_PORTR|nr:hypothetical protein [Portunus trituberculatus]
MPTFLLLLLGLAAGCVQALGSSREEVPAVVALPLKKGKTVSILTLDFRALSHPLASPARCIFSSSLYSPSFPSPPFPP